MATISNTPRPGYVWDATDNVWYPIGVGGHGHPDYITQATAVNPTIIDAKGDILTATAADTPARLAVGNNGETLVADSSTSTGLRYTAGTVQANPVLNSAMQNWQRGTSTSLTASNAYTYVADRWATSTGANQACTISRQVTGDTTNLPFIQYALRYQRNSGQTGTTGLNLSQNFETVNSVAFAGKSITMSFYARAGANYSAASSALSVFLATGTGTDQNQQTTGYSGQALPINGSTAILTTTWQRFTFSATIGATATELCPIFQFTPVGTAGANDYYEITGVQIDIGSVALPFRTYAGTLQGELSACQRYYFRWNASNVNTVFLTGQAYTTTGSVFTIAYPVAMRANPTVIEFASLGASNNTLGVNAVSALGLTYVSSTTGGLQATTTGLTAGNATLLLANTSASAYLGIGAELKWIKLL
jgi:hypothetical protein